jgi:hypothetical protein
VRDAAGEPADRFHLLGLPQLLFQFLAVGDVENDGHKVARSARLVVPQQRRDDVAPEQAAVFPLVAFLRGIDRLGCREHRVAGVVALGAVFGCRQVDERQALELVAAVAGHRAELVVHPDKRPVGADVGDADRCALERQPEARFAVAQLLFRALALGDFLSQLDVDLRGFENFLLQFVNENVVVVLQESVCLTRAIRRYRRRSARLVFDDIANRLDECGRLGRFDDEGVGAEGHRQTLVLRLCVRGRVHDERDGLQSIVGAPLTQQRVAVDHRHEQIRNDEIGRVLSRLGQRVGAVARAVHLVAVTLQQDAQHRQVRGVVVNNQDVHGVTTRHTRHCKPRRCREQRFLQE